MADSDRARAVTFSPSTLQLRLRALGRGVSQGALWCLLWPPVICRGCSLTAAPQRLYSQVRLQRSRACAVSPKRGLSYYCPSSHSAAQSITMTDCAPACGAHIINSTFLYDIPLARSSLSDGSKRSRPSDRQPLPQQPTPRQQCQSQNLAKRSLRSSQAPPTTRNGWKIFPTCSNRTSAATYSSPLTLASVRPSMALRNALRRAIRCKVRCRPRRRM